MMNKAQTYTRDMFESQVVSVDDPKKAMRVQVRVFGVFDGVKDEDLPWATYILPISAREGMGAFTPAEVGDKLWIRFPYVTAQGEADVRRPLIIGAVHHVPEGIPELPDEAFAGNGTYEHHRYYGAPTAEKSGYHEDIVLKNHNMMIELFLTKGGIRVTELQTGSAIEITGKGDRVDSTASDSFEFVGKNSQLNIEGDSTTEIKGKSSSSVGGGVDSEIKGGLTIDVRGQVTLNCTETVKVDAGKIELNGAGGGLVTTECKCQVTGKPHDQGSSSVFAGM